MSIKIVRNEEGNCINFVGSSNPVYFNACLSAEVDANDNNLINVINDIRSSGSSKKFYEFFNIPYTDWSREDGTAFDNPQDVADYITDKADVSNYYGNTIEYNNVNALDIRYGDLSYKKHPIITVFSIDVNGNTHEIFPGIEYNTILQRILITFGDDILNGFIIIR